MQVDLQSVRDSVKYCCFLLEAEVTDSALLALSKEILSDKVCVVDSSHLSVVVDCYLAVVFVVDGAVDSPVVVGCFAYFAVVFFSCRASLVRDACRPCGPGVDNPVVACFLDELHLSLLAPFTAVHLSAGSH